nr:hypothetical protein [Verrucomicrobiota bacterium]
MKRDLSSFGSVALHLEQATPRARCARFVTWLLAFAVTLDGFASGKEGNEERASVILVVGAGGEQEYTEEFARWAMHWQKAAGTAGARLTTIGLKPTAEPDLEQVRKTLLAELPDTPAELWIVLLGHGTADPQDAKLNLRGDDLSAAQLAEWLKPFRRPLVLINAFSSGGAFLKPLAAPGRVVVTATRSGSEHNYARFGRFFSQAIADPAADLDKDGQVSVLEAYLAAAQAVAEFYKNEGRLATEHALLDDNGDGLGTPADWFRGVRAVKKARDDAELDGLRAHQMHLI